MTDPSNSGPDLVRAQRWGALLSGGLVALFGLTRGTAAGRLVALGGAALAARGLVPMRPRALPDTDAGPIEVERAVTIERPAGELFAFWRDFANLPRFMDDLQEVTVGADGRSHWVAKARVGAAIAWDSEIIDETADEMIAWRTLVDTEVTNEGRVRFTPATGNRGTVVTVTLRYLPCQGRAGAVVARMVGDGPDQQVCGDLRRFKALMEAGEVPTPEGQTLARAASTASNTGSETWHEGDYRAMTDEQRGLGHVVYSTESEETLAERKDTTGPADPVDEAAAESFPASDPPATPTGATGADRTVDAGG